MHTFTTKNILKIYNSFSKKKEIFIPIIPGYVGIYVCGVTIYNKVHLGNYRTFIYLDLIVRYFRYLGYKVRYIRNITDVGHLDDESIDRFDKITKKAFIEQVEPMELVQKYTYDFHHILDIFNILSPNIEPIASGHIIEQIEVIKILLKKGFAYEADGSVYFNLNAYTNSYQYGILSRSNIKYSIGIKNKKQKRNTKDFALWKKAESSHCMQWESPWGRGFPGWHIECTSMSTKYLGQVFDIHAGGIDLKFPHHECEIAQSIGSHGKIPVHYWMHSNMLTLKNKKMSKSKGNIIIPSNIFPKYPSYIIRFFIFQTHYRNILDFSNKAIESAEKGYNRLIDSFTRLKYLLTIDIKAPEATTTTSTIDVVNWIQKCYDAMNDDFNSPRLIAHLFEAMHFINALLSGDELLSYKDLRLLESSMKNFLSEVLGLPFSFHKQTSKIKELLNILLEIRSKARTKKNWDFSDKIRKDLLSLGYILYDYKSETKII